MRHRHASRPCGSDQLVSFLQQLGPLQRDRTQPVCLQTVRRSVHEWSLAISYGVCMSHKIAELHALTDQEVIALHDEVARTTSVGTDYWMRELERRSREHSDRTNSRLARASLVLSVVSVVIAMIALFVTR